MQVRVPLAQMYSMPELIDRFVREGRVGAFHHRLSCAWRLFWWKRPHGRAFEMAMCTLKSRVLGGKVRGVRPGRV